MSEGAYTCYSSCTKCNRRIAVEYYEDTFETEENVTFLGRPGTRIYHYCPYCGVKESGFRPYDWDQKMDLSLEDDPKELDEEWDEDSEPRRLDAEGITLIDEDEDDASRDESEKDAFICPACGKRTRLNPKGCDRILCWYCGKDTVREVRQDKKLQDLMGKMRAFQEQMSGEAKKAGFSSEEDVDQWITESRRNEEQSVMIWLAAEKGCICEKRN